METIVKGVGAILFVVAILGLVAAIMALPTMLIVNYLFTSAVLLSVFGIPALTFWKAFWLTFLCGFLFKSSTTSNN